jgi:hypothetical protein
MNKKKPAWAGSGRLRVVEETVEAEEEEEEETEEEGG